MSDYMIRKFSAWLSILTFVTVAHAAPSVKRPSLFGPDVISGPAKDEDAAFTPNGKALYFFRSNGQDYDIMVSHLDGAHWSQPKIASFSGHWRDLEPAMAPDGSYLIFASSRPGTGGDKPIDGHWRGHIHPGRGGNLWRVNRQGDGWSKPIRLPDTVNRVDATFSPTIARDGTLYFMAATGKAGRFQLYRSRFRNGRYQAAVLLPFTKGNSDGMDAAVAPDRSFIVFASTRSPAPPHTTNLFIAFRDNGWWGEPIDLGMEIGKFSPIELGLAPDGHTLYFSSSRVVPITYPKSITASQKGLRQMQSWNNGNGNIWTVDLTPWLKLHSQGQGGHLPEAASRTP
ncbi:MAG: hypothetical protein PVI37_04410 [Gammaproteobacteria bacterium]